MSLVFFSRHVEKDGPEVFETLASMAKLLLRSENLQGVAINMTEAHKSSFIQQTENFVRSLPTSAPESAGISAAGSEKHPTPKLESRKTFVTTQFPVHYCALALPTVPYTHEDSAPLRILAKLLTAKFLLPEVREKGGAYGAGAASNPSTGKSCSDIGCSTCSAFYGCQVVLGLNLLREHWLSALGEN